MNLTRQGDELTEREIGILLALAEGLENSEIAADLFLSVDTVKDNMRVLLIKLGAKNRTHAVALGYHRGLLVPRMLASRQVA